MPKIKDGNMGTGGAERYYEIFDTAELVEREHDTPISNAYNYWLSRRAGNPFPRKDAIADDLLSPESWRLRMADVRSRYPSDFSLVAISEASVLALHKFNVLEQFQRDCLSHDLMQCIDRRIPLYVTEEYIEPGYQYCGRTVYLPTVDTGNEISWIYLVTAYDDERIESNPKTEKSEITQ